MEIQKLIFCSSLFYLIILGALRYRLSKKTSSIQIGSFSKESEAKESFRIVSLILQQYSKQQNWAFGLTWVAIAWSICLGSLFMFSVTRFGWGIESISTGIGIAGGIGISVSAFKLYNKSSKKTEDLLKEFSDKLK